MYMYTNQHWAIGQSSLQLDLEIVDRCGVAKKKRMVYQTGCTEAIYFEILRN